MEETNKKEEINLTALQGEVAEALKTGRPLTGSGGVLTPLIKQFIEASLEGEIEAHLEGSRDKNNRKNGKTRKQVKTGSGSFELETPRDRDGSFEPQIVKKRQVILNESLDQKILGLYGIGMSYQAIRGHMNEMYGLELSNGTLNAITDKLIPVISEWRSRPLEAVYPIVFMDAMFFKVREEGRVQSKAMYTLIGIKQDGYKDVLGVYVAETEGANFWLGVLTDLQSRGVEDILIACVDGLKGFPEAIESVFPHAVVQLCIVHQIRNSLRYVGSKHHKEFMKDLKTVYRSETKELAEQRLTELEGKWGAKYPVVLRSWRTNWERLTAYFDYTAPVRRTIYTTNIIEGFHRQVRKYTKTKGAFSSENALLKLVYCASQQAQKKWTRPQRDWALTLSQFDIKFPGRLKLAANF